MSRDRYRLATAAAVLIVAAIAAVVSYEHIARLALAYGQQPLAAYLLPLSIDGMVATSSLVMLRAARVGVSAPGLARAGLALAVAATLGANVASGLSHGWPGALLAGWPAIAFVVSAETAISMSRRHAAQPPRTAATRPAASKRQHDGQAAAGRPPAPLARPAGRHGQPAQRRSPADTEAAALAALAASPAMTHRQLADAIGVSERTARRVRTRLAHTPGG